MRTVRKCDFDFLMERFYPVFRETIFTGQFSTFIDRWTGQCPILVYITWRDLNQSQPHISIRGITKNQMPYQQLICALKSVALTEVAQVTLREMLWASWHNHEHWMVRMQVSALDLLHGSTPHASSSGDCSFLACETVPQCSDLHVTSRVIIRPA